jgi:hypothetical protein
LGVGLGVVGGLSEPLISSRSRWRTDRGGPASDKGISLLRREGLDILLLYAHARVRNCQVKDAMEGSGAYPMSEIGEERKAKGFMKIIGRGSDSKVAGLCTLIKEGATAAAMMFLWKLHPEREG